MSSDTPRFPMRDELSSEIITDPDGDPIVELEGYDALGLQYAMTLEERAAGEKQWRFGHVIVDEAQDLTPMQWRMIARRARGHSMTIVGDVAQRSSDERATWTELLPEELGDVERFDLGINYRSPSEVADVAGRVLSEVAPDLTAPAAIRSSGHLVERIQVAVTPTLSDTCRRVVTRYKTELPGGRIAILAEHDMTELAEELCVAWYSPKASKGMEFDGVIVLEPADIIDQPGGMSLLYVAVTRSTGSLAIVHTKPLPTCLA